MKVRKHYMPSDETIYTKTGTDVVSVFTLSEDETKIVPCGKKNICKEVNSYRDSTDINVILHQLSINDSTMFNRIREGEFTSKEGAYFDTTVFPKTIHEFNRMVEISNKAYNSLPKEITDQFNSIDDFVKSDDNKLKAIFDSYNAKLIKNNETVENNNTEEKGDI